MQLRISELIAALTEIQSIAGDATTNCDAVRLKTVVENHYDNTDTYYVGRQQIPKRLREFSVWLESYPDGPQCEPEPAFTEKL